MKNTIIYKENDCYNYSVTAPIIVNNLRSLDYNKGITLTYTPEGVIITLEESLSFDLQAFYYSIQKDIQIQDFSFLHISIMELTSSNVLTIFMH